MLINTTLADFRHRFPGCDAVAFADISASMVLATNASTPLDQEFWDEMADVAEAHLNAETSDNIAKCLNDGATERLTYTILADNLNFQIFVRSSIHPAFAICGLISQNTDFTGFFSAAQKLADALVQDA